MQPHVPLPEIVIEVRALHMRHAGALVQRDLAFEVRRGELLGIAGASGCGKSTLLRHLAGLQRPAAGQILLHGHDLHAGDAAELLALRRRLGVMFQAGALWSAMSVGENLMLPMRLCTTWPAVERERRARLQLALVGLEGAFELAPAALSGGMRKRAAIARALALDPELLFLDEPGAGLDPLNAARLDELIAQLRDHLGTTIVLVSHEVPSLLALADRLLFLDEQEKTMTALDAPARLLEQGPPRVRAFLQHGIGR